MDIRFIGRLTILMLICFAVAIPVLGSAFNKEVGNAPWYALGAALVITALLFQGWGRVGGTVSRSTQRALPHMQGAGHAVGRQAKNNVAATLALACLALFAGSAVWGSQQAAMFFLYSSILLGIAHYRGVDHFGAYWTRYLLALSLVGALHTFAFGYGWKTVAAFVVSAILAAITALDGWGTTPELVGKAVKKIGKFLSMVLFGGYGRETACFSWAIASCLVAVSMPAYAFPAMAAAIGLFIGAIMLGVNDRVIKKAK